MRGTGIYQAKNKTNGKVYVGSAKNIRQRVAQHLRQLKAGTHHSRKFQRSWDKYGADAFEWSILEIVDDPRWLPTIETAWIAFLRAAKNATGLNILETGHSTIGLKLTEEQLIRRRAIFQDVWSSPEVRAKQSVSQRERWKVMSSEERRVFGCAVSSAWTPERREKMAALQQGQKRGEDVREKMSEANRRNWQDPTIRQKRIDGIKGQTRDSEQRRRMSEAQRALAADPGPKGEAKRKASSKGGKAHRKQYRVTSPDGEVFTILGLREFCAANGLTAPNMHAVMNGKTAHHKGWKCEKLE